MLRKVKCESTVDTVIRNEINVLNCSGNTFCLTVVNTVEINFVNWFHYFARLMKIWNYMG